MEVVEFSICVSSEVYDSGLLVVVDIVFDFVCGCRSLIEEVGWVYVFYVGDFGSC